MSVQQDGGLTIESTAAVPAVYEDISPRCIGIMDRWSKPIRRAVNAATAAIQNVRIDHRGADISVPRKLLNSNPYLA